MDVCWDFLLVVDPPSSASTRDTWRCGPHVAPRLLFGSNMEDSPRILCPGPDEQRLFVMNSNIQLLFIYFSILLLPQGTQQINKDIC